VARRPFLLRIDQALLETLQGWANDDLRSLNGQIEFLLRRAAQEAGRLRASRQPTPGAEEASGGGLGRDTVSDG
jgi:hypothetical protein